MAEKELSGIVVVHKEQGMTSQTVVNRVKRIFGVAKAGHTGTLDPLATGVLPVLVGRAVKASEFMLTQDKHYLATLKLGITTDTEDVTGEILSESALVPTEDEVRAAVSSFVGEIMQTPPMVSAVKKDGERLYKLARQGVEVEREAKPVTIHSVDLANFQPPYCDFVVRCSKGTYIRTLCADVGASLGCGAALYRLNRIQSGEFELTEAVTIDEMKTWDQAQLADYVDHYLHTRIQKIQKFSDF